MLMVGLLALGSACAADEAQRSGALREPAEVRDPACDPVYAEAFDAWRHERESGLRDPEGYLGLAGLYWLASGSNVVGCDPGSDVVLPEGRGPGRVGVISLSEGRAVLTVEPGVYVTHNGRPVTEMELSFNSATPCRVGQLSFHLIERGVRVGLRLRDPQSPVLAAYDGTEVWPPRDAWRVPARYVPSTIPRIVNIPNVLGSSYQEPELGRLEFELDGARHTLVVTGSGAESLFVIFGDESNGRGSYSGGRFLRVPPADDLGSTLIDFNRAYNPPCAYSPFTTCPLPPEGNLLPFAVTAGERAWEH
ncbi:MAG: hypothetical protein DRQ55_03710 [Planctomycetota bacterium]|nr:MAG: hypothetical protein DRQ55_03710 [Planctomycetota bacterium]